MCSFHGQDGTSSLTPPTVPSHEVIPQPFRLVLLLYSLVGLAPDLCQGSLGARAGDSCCCRLVLAEACEVDTEPNMG